MTGLGTVTLKDFLKPLKPSVGQKQKADTHVPALDYYGEDGGRGKVRGDRLRSTAGRADKFLLWYQ